jgi:hypothetical protein
MQKYHNLAMLIFAASGFVLMVTAMLRGDLVAQAVAMLVAAFCVSQMKD